MVQQENVDVDRLTRSTAKDKFLHDKMVRGLILKAFSQFKLTDIRMLPGERIFYSFKVNNVPVGLCMTIEDDLGEMSKKIIRVKKELSLD